MGMPARVDWVSDGAQAGSPSVSSAKIDRRATASLWNANASTTRRPRRADGVHGPEFE